MFGVKKLIVALLTTALIGLASSAWAGTYGPLYYDIVIDASTFDVAGFDLTILYDNSQLNFSGYTLTDELGSFETGDAEDWSYSEAPFVVGEVSLSAFSYLWDEELVDQSDTLILATLQFWGDEDALADITTSYLDIAYVNTANDELSFVAENNGTSGMKISAVPVPSAFSLLSIGLLSLVTLARRRA